MKRRTKSACFLLIEMISWFFLLWVDLRTKSAAVDALKGKFPYVLIEGVLEFRYIQNTGAAFSMLENAQWLFILIAAAAIVVIAWVVIKMPKTRHYLPMHILLTLISAGAAGNLYDRITLGYVRDFIYISLIDFPIFNVADMYVTVSTFILVICILFIYSEDDFRFAHRKKDDVQHANSN